MTGPGPPPASLRLPAPPPSSPVPTSQMHKADNTDPSQIGAHNRRIDRGRRFSSNHGQLLREMGMLQRQYDELYDDTRFERRSRQSTYHQPLTAVPTYDQTPKSRPALSLDTITPYILCACVLLLTLLNQVWSS